MKPLGTSCSEEAPEAPKRTAPPMDLLAGQFLEKAFGSRHCPEGLGDRPVQEIKSSWPHGSSQQTRHLGDAVKGRNTGGGEVDP